VTPVSNDFFYPRRGLRDHLDANGDLAPPWVKFPTYERGTIGWRMGAGEDWLSYWWVFVEGLDHESRFALLRRHRPAPVTWADWVYRFLYPAAKDEDDEYEDAVLAERTAWLRAEGLVASDVAYHTWLLQQPTAVEWPWEQGRTPEDAARYWTRNFWFWSRRMVGMRGEAGWKPLVATPSWEGCAETLRTGQVHSPDVRAGLLTLARMLAAGRVAPPWELGLTPADFADTFDDDMSYTDAFRLWGICALDDREQFDQFVGDVPAAWEHWVAEQFQLH